MGGGARVSKLFLQRIQIYKKKTFFFLSFFLWGGGEEGGSEGCWRK